MDDGVGSVGLTKDNGRNTSIDAMRQNKIDAMRRNAWYIGHCLQCKNEFKKRTVWQKYCSEECRKIAYEQRTSKKWYRKKSVADG